MYSLYFAREQIELVIKEIRGSDKNREQCISQGFCPGTEVVLQRVQGDNMLIRLHSSYFIIGKELARLIFVQEKSSKN